MRRVPEWLEQVIGGLNGGKNWLVRSVRELPTFVRVFGWLVFQAILFKIQPQLWHALLEVTQFVVGLLAMRLPVQLLLVVIAFLTGQTLLVENRFKGLRRIVENMESSSGAEEIASDGGTNVEINAARSDRRRWWICVACGAITGGEIGLFWGPAGVIGLAVLGAMIGDEWVRRTRDEQVR